MLSSYPFLAEITSQLPSIMPDYMLVFAISVLAHHPDFDNIEDIDMLKRIRNALWFTMEPLMSKNDNFSFGFYKALVEKIKNHIDALDEEAYNDVSFNFLIKVWTNFEFCSKKRCQMHSDLKA